MRQLAGCLDALSDLERRVLILRAGVGRQRPHTRGTTARRLSVPVERITAAERRGLRRLSAANRSTGCAAGVPARRSAGVGAALSRAGVQLAFDSPTAPEAARPAADRGRDSGGVKDEKPSAGQSGLVLDPAAPGGVATPDDQARLLLPMLALLIVMLAIAVLLPGRRAATAVAHRRAEQAEERRHEELVRAVLSVLGEPRPPRRN